MNPIRLVPADELQLRPRLGVAKLAKLAFDGNDMNPLWADMVSKLKADPTDVDTAMDLSIVAQLTEQKTLGLELQAQALAVRALYRSPCAAERPRLTVLAFAAATDIGGNTPLEFLLEDSDIALYTFYVVPGMALPEALPDHDVAFVAVPDSDETRLTLQEIQRLTHNWPRPVINTARKIGELERDRLFRLLANVSGLAVPATARIDRDDLHDAVNGEAPLSDLMAGAQFPLIVRPVGSQAGRGLDKLESIDDVEPYLAFWPDEDFFISPFIDYSGDDGLFRKYRIVFVDGAPYACHMAIAEEWRLWYLNADMSQSEDKRAEEAHFMTEFDRDFARRHGSALHEIALRTGLDYFAIDCAETQTGDLLIFEADIAMIVHNMDPAELYPYKAPQMRKIFAAFAAMLEARAGKSRAEAA
jgi:hypothetical protein